MDFSKAKQEFQVRYYLWAISEWEKEINESLASFNSFKSGMIWKTYQFMRLLDKSEQLKLSRGLLKRFHADAVKSLGESCSHEEESLREARKCFFDIRQAYQNAQQLQKEGQFDVAEYWIRELVNGADKVPGVVVCGDERSLLSQLAAVFQRIPISFEEEIAVRKRAGEKPRFAGKRSLQTAITEKFQNAFGDHCTHYDYNDIGDPHTEFDMLCCGWVLSTHFWFGRQKSLINYSHSIASPTKIHHERYPEITAPVLRMALGISWSSWLGITSQIRWEYLFKEEVEPSCDAVVKHCKHFFEVAPKLLKGLEFEKITAN